jgi:hypothetical protein
VLPGTDAKQLLILKPTYPWGTDWAAIRTSNDAWRRSAKPDDFIPCHFIRGRAEAYQQRVWDLIRATTSFICEAAVAGDFGMIVLDGEELSWVLDYECPHPYSHQDLLHPSIRRKIRVSLTGRFRNPCVCD